MGYICSLICRSGGIGRRTRFRGVREQSRASSSLAFGTPKPRSLCGVCFFYPPFTSCNKKFVTILFVTRKMLQVCNISEAIYFFVTSCPTFHLFTVHLGDFGDYGRRGLYLHIPT
jgi:hypothetical protein